MESGAILHSRLDACLFIRRFQVVTSCIFRVIGRLSKQDFSSTNARWLYDLNSERVNQIKYQRKAMVSNVI